MTDELTQSFEFYRAQMENPSARALSMEFEGLDRDEFEAGTNDASSAVIMIEHGDDTLLRLPLAVPLAVMPWRNANYYRRRLGTDGPLYYYNNLPDLLTSDPDAYLAAMLPVFDTLADTDGVLTTDHAHTDRAVVDRDIGFIAASLGFKLSKDLLEGEKRPSVPGEPPRPQVQHYLYLGQMLPTDRGPLRLEKIDFPKVYEVALAAGKLATEKATLDTSLTEDETTKLWEYYDAAFSKLNNDDPVLASFPKEQFTDIMKSEEFLKLTYRSGGDITNVCVITDIRNCPWMNQAYYQSKHPEAYNEGMIYHSPCVVSKPGVGIAGMSLATMGLLIKGFCEADVTPMMTFACDEISNTQVPGLSERSIKRSDKLTADFSNPDMLHIFRAFKVKRR